MQAHHLLSRFKNVGLRFLNARLVNFYRNGFLLSQMDILGINILIGNAILPVDIEGI